MALRDMQQYPDWYANGEPKEVHTVLTILANAPSDVFQTGSRYMGCERPDSDWDFMAEYSTAMVEYLLAFGFTIMGGFDADEVREYPPSDWTQYVMALRTPSGGVVQVQVRNQVDVTRKVRDIIRDHCLQAHIKMDKHERRELWDGLSTLLTMQPASTANLGITDDLPF